MANQPIINDMPLALTNRIRPTVTLWNRLEGRPRREDFNRALRAEIRDPLWMVAQQWQMGEFEGDDAGSPVTAKVFLQGTRLNQYRPGPQGSAPATPFDQSLPLEAKVEQQVLPLTRNGKPFSLDLRLLMGRHWLKLLRANLAQVGDVSDVFQQKFPISRPNASLKEDADIVAHPEVFQTFAAVAGRAMDGGALYLFLKDGTQVASDQLEAPLPPQAEQDALNALGVKFVAWVNALFQQPDQEESQAWLSDRLEYQFGCAAPEGNEHKAYEAEEYYQGRLDWYSFSIDDESTEWDLPPGETPPAPTQVVSSFVPVQLTFEGMPHPRWWTFEDNKTYFGDIDPDTTDLSKLLFMEFGLVYANDWFVIPHQVEAGSITQVRGLSVTNVFGERTWIEASGRGQDDDWQRWSMFTVSRKGQDLSAADNSLLMLPTVPKVQEGKALDEIFFLRDEVANMVWGLEQRIPLPDGSTKPGSEAAIETRRLYERLLAEAIEGGLTPGTPEWLAAIRYEVVNSVPENWIPMIPVHLDNNNREVQLRRAAMPRNLAGDPEAPERVRPRTILLRQGLEDTPRRPYFLHEEEVPRAGVMVSQSYQRTRWYGGQVVTWLGVRKQAGRGEGSSGLAFDRVVQVKNRS